MDDLVALMNEMPFTSRLGVEIIEAADGHARATLEMEDWHSSSHVGQVAHGGVTYSLADTAGGAAVISLNDPPTPTVDMRIDYLSPARTDLYASAEVIRHGSNLSMASVEVEDAEGEQVATAQGTYKSGGQGEATPWNEPDDA